MWRISAHQPLTGIRAWHRDTEQLDAETLVWFEAHHILMRNTFEALDRSGTMMSLEGHG